MRALRRIAALVLITAGCSGATGAKSAKSTASGATASPASAMTSGAASASLGVAAPASFAVAVRAPAFGVSAISIVANASASAPIAAGFTAIQYTVSEPHGAPVTIHVQIDAADGRGFRAATQAPNAPGVPFHGFTIEGPTNVPAVASGTAHVFLWDSSVDARGTTTDLAQVRIWARTATATSAPATISNVKIRNATTSRATALDAPRRAIGGGASQLRFATLADLNRDGKLDLVAVDRSASSISVFLGLGDGAFAPPIVVAPGASLPFASVRDVAIADLDQDGIADLAFADPLGHAVWVVPGKGDGTFALPRGRSYATGGFFPSGLVAADVDGDGRLDLVALDGGGTELRVLQNASPSGFVAAGSTTLAVAATALAAGDFDGDGRSDVVLVNSGNDTVSLLIAGAKAGTFVARSFAVGKKPSAVAVLDANSDGKLDLAVANQGDDDVAVLLGDGAGKLGAPASFATGLAPGALAAADLDGDGRVDLVVGAGGIARETILVGDGKGNFLARPFVENAGGATATSIAVGDVNGDGAADVVFTSLDQGLPAQDDAFVTLLLGNGSADFSGKGTALASASPMPYLLCDRAPVVIADVNLDGHPDLIAGNQDGTISVFTGSATGFSPPTKVVITAVAIEGLAVFDADGDGKPDLVALAKTSPCDAVYVLPQIFDGTGAHYGWRPPIAANGGQGFGSSIDLAVGDVNGDGIADLVIPNRYENSVSVLLGDGAGGYQMLGGAPLALGPASPSASGPIAAKIADVNGDGAPDLVVLSNTDDSITVLLGPTFATRTTFPSSLAPPAGARLQARSLVVADLDGDGRLDLAFCEPGGFGVAGTIFLWKGDGNGGFAQVATIAHPGPAALAVADVNGDGALDLVVTSAVTSFATKPSPTVSFLLQGPAWKFAASDPEAVAVGDTPVFVTTGDANGDGRLDVVVGCPGDGTIRVVFGK